MSMKLLQYSFVVCTGLFFSVPAIATGPILTEVLETMMEAHTNEGLFIGHVFGVDDETVLRFNFNVDPVNRSFSYSLLPNQFYQGLEITLTASGIYDSSLEEYNWTSSGVLGDQSWTTIGSVGWIGDPQGTVSTTVTLGGVEYKVHGDVEWDQGPINATSKGSYTFKTPDGKTFGPYEGSDMWDIPTGRWKHTVTVPRNPVTPDGIVVFSAGITAAPGGGASNFDMRINSVPVPEPSSTLSFLALGTVGAASTLKRKLKSSKSTEKETTKVG